MTTFAYTSDFREEFEAETTSLLRRRFTYFIWLNFALFLVSHFSMAALRSLYYSLSGDTGDNISEKLAAVLLRNYSGWGGLVGVSAVAAINLTLVLVCRRSVRRNRLDGEVLLRLTQWVFFSMGMVDIASYVLGRAESAGFPLTIGFAHLLASLLLPWSPRQAVRPMALLLAVNALSIFAVAYFWMRHPLTSDEILAVALSPLAGVPGALAAMLRHSRRMDRFKLRFLQSRYGQIRRELIDARRIHESLFPKPLIRGALRFDYRYEPMRQIGGDYFYAKFSPPVEGRPAALNAILIDVTGHGIAAALTVNRLYGEVERLFAEDPNAHPGEVLRALNRYVYLTMANHSIFATALCVRIDPGAGQIEFASGGHPPAFLRAVDGTLEQLSSTAIVLGAHCDADFDPAPESRRFFPGDTLIAYTDGAIEARNGAGRMLGVTGIERLLATIAPSIGGGWAAAIVAAVDSHRHGPAHDDTLVVEVYRPLNLDTDSTRTTRTHSRDGAMV